MINYFPETRIPVKPERKFKGLEDSQKSVGETNPKPLLETLLKTTVEEPIFTKSSWFSKVVELDFKSLTDILKVYERDFGFSTIEMFNRYMNGEFSEDPNIDYWVNTFILYLGTNQVRQYSCPKALIE